MSSIESNRCTNGTTIVMILVVVLMMDECSSFHLAGILLYGDAAIVLMLAASCRVDTREVVWEIMLAKVLGHQKMI